MMQLITPTPRNALRQLRNASFNSERRAPSAAAIQQISSIKPQGVPIIDLGFGRKHMKYNGFRHNRPTTGPLT
ncbi:hypothetical protein [Bradyrhizobium sp.]|jgi:hypothetical protein|uniref:hypothetical protein n=1 Tax=Bradyrhizobium sp. TaxID=376 RepID=UPI003C7B58B8